MRNKIIRIFHYMIFIIYPLPLKSDTISNIISTPNQTNSLILSTIYNPNSTIPLKSIFSSNIKSSNPIIKSTNPIASNIQSTNPLITTFFSNIKSTNPIKSTTFHSSIPVIYSTTFIFQSFNFIISPL